MVKTGKFLVFSILILLSSSNISFVEEAKFFKYDPERVVPPIDINKYVKPVAVPSGLTAYKELSAPKEMQNPQYIGKEPVFRDSLGFNTIIDDGALNFDEIAKNVLTRKPSGYSTASVKTKPEENIDKTDIGSENSVTSFNIGDLAKKPEIYSEASNGSCTKLISDGKIKKSETVIKILSVKKSGDNRIDALIAGDRFAETKLKFMFDDENNLPTYFKDGIRKAFFEWQRVSNLKFEEVKGPNRCNEFVHIKVISKDVNKTDLFKSKFKGRGNGGGYAEYAATHVSGIGSFSDTRKVYIDNSYSEEAMQPTGHGFKVALHEIGHTIGLKHPGKYGENDTEPFLPKTDDNNSKTVMSYHPSEIYKYPGRPQEYDILAIQYLYGKPGSVDTVNTASK